MVEVITLNPAPFDYCIHAGQTVTLDRFAYNEDAESWTSIRTAPELILHVNGYTISTAAMTWFSDKVAEMRDDGSTQLRVSAFNEPFKLQIDLYYRTFPDAAVIEKWAVVTNRGAEPVTIGRFDTFTLALPAGDYTLRYFESKWTEEFSPVVGPLRGTKILEGTAGRSSRQMHPWFALEHPERGVLASTIAWSGNWIYRFEPGNNGLYWLSGGLNPWGFDKVLAKGESVEGAHVFTALGEDLDETAVALARWGREYGYPRNDTADSMPVEWNTWWPYEDFDLTSKVWRANIDQAARMGFDMCVLDAGWFGDEGDTERWFTLRGDWDTVNAKRFPEGIRAVSDYAHEKGLKFGLWFEIESVGVDAQLNETRPDLIARRDGESLHAICLGNPDAAEWAFETLSRLVTEYACDWIKLDYNVDVWAGCNRDDHGHAPGEGLYAHVRAYYALLDRMRAAFPDLIIEACSSGGLRIDLGLLQHLHFTFISDPDYPDHSLQCFWGATQMLAPEACLHFTWSQNTGHFPTLNLAGGDKDIEPHRLDTYMRIGMLHRIGISHKLPEITPWVRDRIAAHIRTYKVKIAPFIREADLYHLTGQPLRQGEGERWAAFEYLKADRETALVFVFRLEGAEPENVLKFKRLIPERSYTLSWEDDKEPPQTKSGAEWMSEGLVLGGLLEDDSAILWLEAS